MTVFRRLETGSFGAVQILENIYEEPILPRNKICYAKVLVRKDWFLVNVFQELYSPK
jgi:hypothetical protein